MLFYSTNAKCGPVSFRDAVLRGLADDGGLFMPAGIPVLDPDFLANLRNRSLIEIGVEVAAPFVRPDISQEDLAELIRDAFPFDAPLVQLSENLHVLELFHGPTLAFKDFGARFMARVLSGFRRDSSRPLTVLVATSGDTGSAVAHGFYHVEGIRVVLLYPAGKISVMQERQMTTLGGNIQAVAVAGAFDDCQRLVKEAFQDPELRERTSLTSANSINIARLIPQSFYYFRALAQLQDPSREIVLSVPSGNFGNLTAGLMAKFMGLPVHRFVAATNANAVVPRYLETGIFQPQPSQKTISNAMDVGNPSNFARMLALYKSDPDRMKQDLCGASFDDDQTRSAISELYRIYRYPADPHTAVAYLGLKQFQQNSTKQGIFLSTAHPGKFQDIVEQATGAGVDLPQRLRECLDKPQHSISLSSRFEALKSYLMDHP